MKNIKTFEAFDSDELNKKLYLAKGSKTMDYDSKPTNSTPKQGLVDKMKDLLFNVNKAKEMVAGVRWEDLKVKRMNTNDESTFFRIFLPDAIQMQIKKSRIDFNYVEFKVDNLNIYNRVHTTGIPEKLQKLGLGYKCYKALTKELGWIMSASNASSDAKAVWKKLMKDDNYYSALSKDAVLIIKKTLLDPIPKAKIKEIILNFLTFNFVKVEGETDKEIINKLAKKQFPIKLDNALKVMFKDDELRKLDIDLFDRMKKINGGEEVEEPIKKRRTIGGKDGYKTNIPYKAEYDSRNRGFKMPWGNVNVNNEAFGDNERPEFLDDDEMALRFDKWKKEQDETETITTTRGDVVVSNTAEIPTDAKYATREENSRRYVIYSKHVSGTLGYNPRLIVATILPLTLEGIPAIKPKNSNPRMGGLPDFSNRD